MTPYNYRRAGVGVILAAALSLASLVAPPPAQAEELSASSCRALDDPIHHAVRTTNGNSLLTPWESEATSASRHGYQYEGVLFRASTKPAPGLVALHRMFRNTSGQNFLYSTSDKDRQTFSTKYGYVDQGANFYVAVEDSSCVVPVHRLRKSGKDRYALAGGVAKLKAAGWSDDGPWFYVAPPEGVAGADEDPKFSFAVIPDTQQEVFEGRRFINRTEWLVDQQDKLDLEFVTHTGDLVNWDTPDHAQYELASKGMVPLEKAGIPYSIAIGNHDTQAVKEGGSARDPKRTRELQRDTRTFNKYFTAGRYGGVTGAFEKGKVDNVYSVYEAGGTKWMVLVLELWPREEVVEWAKRVVAANPDVNVIVNTHHHLESSLKIGQSRQYGHTSPQYVFDNLVSRYPNIKVVVSGHVGQAGYRLDTGRHGNKIHSFLTTFHSNESNPVRLFEVDTEKDTLKTWIYGPYTKQTWGQYGKTVAVDWID